MNRYFFVVVLREKGFWFILGLFLSGKLLKQPQNHELSHNGDFTLFSVRSIKTHLFRVSWSSPEPQLDELVSLGYTVR